MTRSTMRNGVWRDASVSLLARRLRPGGVGRVLPQALGFRRSAAGDRVLVPVPVPVFGPVPVPVFGPVRALLPAVVPGLADPVGSGS